MSKLLSFSANANLIDKIPPEDKIHFARGFDPYEETIEELEECVKLGISFSYQYVGGVRKSENFLKTDILAVDMDGGRTIKDCLADPVVKEYCSLFYTTPSHTIDHNRFRLVFILPRTITDVEELKCAARSLTRRIGGDPATTDGARIFFGSNQQPPTVIPNPQSSASLRYHLQYSAV